MHVAMQIGYSVFWVCPLSSATLISVHAICLDCDNTQTVAQNFFSSIPTAIKCFMFAQQQYNLPRGDVITSRCDLMVDPALWTSVSCSVQRISSKQSSETRQLNHW